MNTTHYRKAAARVKRAIDTSSASAFAAAVRSLILDELKRGTLFLDFQQFATFRLRGLTRSNVLRAVDSLAADGLVEVTRRSRCVIVRAVVRRRGGRKGGAR